MRTFRILLACLVLAGSLSGCIYYSSDDGGYHHHHNW
jgi:hypothetical protein